MPKLSQCANLVQTMVQVRVGNTAEDAALVLCLRQHLSSNLGGGAFKSTDPDFLVNHYEIFSLKLFPLPSRPSSKKLERTVLKAHDGISVNDAREWAKKCVFSPNTSDQRGTDLWYAYQTLQISESGSAVTCQCRSVCCGKEPQSCLLRKKVKTLQKEKAVARSQKRKTTSEGASASKHQSILAAKAVGKKPAARGKSGANSKSLGSKKESSPAEIAPDHQLEEIVSASPSSMFPRLTNWSITRFPKAANMLHWG